MAASSDSVAHPRVRPLVTKGYRALVVNGIFYARMDRADPTRTYSRVTMGYKLTARTGTVSADHRPPGPVAIGHRGWWHYRPVVAVRYRPSRSASSYRPSSMSLSSIHGGSNSSSLKRWVVAVPGGIEIGLAIGSLSVLNSKIWSLPYAVPRCGRGTAATASRLPFHHPSWAWGCGTADDWTKTQTHACSTTSTNFLVSRRSSSPSTTTSDLAAYQTPSMRLILAATVFLSTSSPAPRLPLCQHTTRLRCLACATPFPAPTN